MVRAKSQWLQNAKVQGAEGDAGGDPKQNVLAPEALMRLLSASSCIDRKSDVQTKKGEQRKGKLWEKWAAYPMEADAIMHCSVDDQRCRDQGRGYDRKRCS